MEQVEDENENIEAVSDVTEEITRNDIDDELVIIQSERKCCPVFSLRWYFITLETCWESD